MVRVAGLERNVSWSQRDSNPVLHGQGLHLPVFAPFNLVSGGVVRSVSMFSGGRCGQICGRSSTLPRARQNRRPAGAFVS